MKIALLCLCYGVFAILIIIGVVEICMGVKDLKYKERKKK